jgi:opacity protein-like surface antigen
MKRIGLILMFLLFSQAAFAMPNTGFYVGISGGYVIPQTATMFEPHYGHTDTTLENGGFVGVKSGWPTPFTRRIMALEMEYNYIFGTDFDKSKVVNLAGWGPGALLDGTIGVHAFLFNIKARYPEGPIHPYAGAGLGYSYFQMGDITARDGGGGLIDSIPGGSGGAFSYQFMAGLDVDIAPSISLGAGYKYFAAKPNIKDDTFYAHGYHGYNYDLDYRTSILSLGLTFTF